MFNHCQRYCQPNHHCQHVPPSQWHLVEHLEGPVVDGNIGRTDEEGEDFGKRPNQHVRHLCVPLSLHWFILEVLICLKGNVETLKRIYLWWWCHTLNNFFFSGHQYLIHQIYTSLSALKKSTFTRHYHIKIFSLHDLLNKMVRIDCTTKGVK